MIPILILAAGQSSRMGGIDKLLQSVQGKPLLRLITQRALVASDDVYVALPDDAAARLAVIDGLPITPLIIPQASQGMSVTMRHAVAHLPDTDFLLMLADLPDITAADMTAIIAARTTHPDHLIWRGATTIGKPGHPIVFAAQFRPKFADLTSDDGGEAIVKPLHDRTHLTRFDTDRARHDLDTPADWAAYNASII